MASAIQPGMKNCEATQIPEASEIVNSTNGAARAVMAPKVYQKCGGWVEIFVLFGGAFLNILFHF